MTDAQNETAWRLTVYYDPGHYEIVDFDDQPTVDAGQKIVSYFGRHDGQGHWADVNMDKAFLWTLQAIPRQDRI